MTTTLYRAGGVHGHPHARSVLVLDERIAAIGTDAESADAVVDLGDAWLAPAFVDAHVHCTQTGLVQTGLDLHGVPSADDLLERVAVYVRAHPGRVVIGSGWDDTTWPRRPGVDELQRASGGGLVYLARVDVHSALASAALLARAGVTEHDDGLVRLDVHHQVRAAARAALTPAQIADAQRRTLETAAGLGIGCVHEMAGPDIAGADDVRSLWEVAAEVGVDVVAYWAALGEIDAARELGCVAAGGDLFCDGSLGSRTAALRDPYTDAPDTSGVLRHDAAAIAGHVIAAVNAGLHSGFHAIGDAAIDAVLTGYETAALTVNLRQGRHRIEHAECLDSDAIRRMDALGLVASVQPAFDAAWGGIDGMYVRRLGDVRATAMNPYAALHDAGVPLAFGSDSPVTPLDPWGAIRAAMQHHQVGQRLSFDVAFGAHTEGGRYAAGEAPGSGTLLAGMPATFAAWDREPDAELSTTPTCRRTVVRGRTVFG